MSDYLSAYRARLERNHNELLNLAKEVTTIDPTIEAYIYKNKHLTSTVVFIKGESINTIHFHEVPYRWSGCGYSEHGNSHHGIENNGMPFTAEEVLHTFKPISSIKKSQPNEYFKAKEDYLNWCSYLELITGERVM